jgi:hypothetical protein
MQFIEKVVYSDLNYNDYYETENDSLFYKLSFESQLCDHGKEITSINSNISEIYTSDFVGIKTMQEDEIIIIVPNPANSFINIDIKNSVAKITITDLQGKILLSKKNFKGGEIFVGNLKPGTYFVKIETIEKITVKKLVVE